MNTMTVYLLTIQQKIEFNDEDDVSLSLWTRHLKSDSSVSPGMWDDYVHNDSALLTSEEPTDENIVQNITANEQHKADEKEEAEEESMPTAKEA